MLNDDETTSSPARRLACRRQRRGRAGDGVCGAARWRWHSRKRRLDREDATVWIESKKIMVVCTNLRKNLCIKMDKICGRKRSKDERLWLERGWWESSSAKTKRAQDDSVCAWELIARVAGCFTQQLEGPNLCGLKFLAQPTYSQASSTGLAIGYMTCEQSPYRDEFILNYLPIYLSIIIYLILKV